MLFSGSTLPPPLPPFIAFSLLTAIIFFLFSPLILKKCLFHPLMGLCYLRGKHTHTHRWEKKNQIHTHTHTYIDGQRGRGWTFDSSEMVDLLMAVTVRRNGWFTWTQPHLSLSRRFLPLYRRQMFTGSYQTPNTTLRRGVWEKKTDTRTRWRERGEKQRKKESDNSEIDRSPGGDAIRQNKRQETTAADCVLGLKHGNTRSVHFLNTKLLYYP